MSDACLDMMCCMGAVSLKNLACAQRQASTTKASSAPATPWPGFLTAAVLKRAKHGEAPSAIHVVAGDPNVL